MAGSTCSEPPQVPASSVTSQKSQNCRKDTLVGSHEKWLLRKSEDPCFGLGDCLRLSQEGWQKKFGVVEKPRPV